MKNSRAEVVHYFNQPGVVAHGTHIHRPGFSVGTIHPFASAIIASSSGETGLRSINTSSPLLR